MNTERAITDMPAYVAGTWTVDPVHSDVSFKVRHLRVSNIRGKFHGVTGTIVLADDPLASSAVAEIDLVRSTQVTSNATATSARPASSTSRSTRT